LNRVAAGPAWHEPALWYSCLGGIAAGSFALACLAEFFWSEADRSASRGAFDLALPLAGVCAVLLTAGAGRTGTTPPAALGAFTACALLSFLNSRAREGRLGRVRRRLGPWGDKTLAAAGAAAALAFGTTAGLVLPLGWGGSVWARMLLIVSAVPAGVSAVVLVDRWRRPGAGDAAAERLGRLNGAAVVAELAVLTGLALTARGPFALAFLRWPGMLIPLFVVPVGLILPLILGESRGVRGDADAALLVLLGGFVLRAALAGMPDSVTHY